MIYAEVAFIAALICINGLLAMAELAVVSSRRPRLQALVARDIAGAKAALALAADPGRFLSTVQIGITLVGVLSGAVSGATLGLRLANWLQAQGLPPAAADAAGVGLIVAAITYVALIVGELVPKQIALRDPERIAARVAPAMTMLATVASPVVWLLDVSGRLVLRALGYKALPESRVSEEEIRTLIAEAETAGIIEPSEREMIAGVMRLGDRPVRAVMTPRREVEMVDLADDLEASIERIVNSIHSRLPVYAGKPEKVLGVIQAKDLLSAYARGERPDIGALVREVPMIPDTADALDILPSIKASAPHMALVLDEYGHFEGILTTADILEAIVGEFQDSEPHAVQREDGSWLISGSMPVDEMAEDLAIPLAKDRAYHTAAGFVLSRIGRLPEVGDAIDIDGWRFEVADMDGRRLDKILASRLPATRRAS